MNTVMFDAMRGPTVLLLYLPFLLIPVLVIGVISLIVYIAVSGKKRKHEAEKLMQSIAEKDAENDREQEP